MEREYRRAHGPLRTGVVSTDPDVPPGKRTLSDAIAWPDSTTVIQRSMATDQPAGLRSASPPVSDAMRGDPMRPALDALFGARTSPWELAVPGSGAAGGRSSAQPIQAKGIARDPDAAGARSAPASAGHALPEPVQAKMERAFGADFSGVRIHQDGSADAMGVLAYTRGANIHFASGQYDPGNQAGQELLGHELTHVVQQSQGRVSAPAQSKGAAINADPGLEREADELGSRAARGEVVAGGGRGGAAQTPRDSAVQAKINYDKTWAALGGYGAWHEGKHELWTQIEPQYNGTFLTLIAWLDGAGQAKCALLAQVEAVQHKLRADLATVDQFRVHDSTNISVQVGENIRDTLIPILQTDVPARVNAWYGTQLQQQQDRVAQLRKKLTDGTDAATVHGALNLLAKPEAFTPHKQAREQILNELTALAKRTGPDEIARELASTTRAGNRTYDTWIDAVIVQYRLAKQEILAARAKQGLEKQAQQEREQERLEDERRQLEALTQETETINDWAGGAKGQLKALYSHEELLSLAGAVRPGDAGRVAAITTKVPDLKTNKARLIELLIAHKADLKSFASLMTMHDACAFTLLSGGLPIAATEQVLTDPDARPFIELYSAPAVKLIKSNSHAAALVAFGTLRGKSYLQEAWLKPHLESLTTLDKKIANTPGVDHFVRTYGSAGLDAIVPAPEITNKGTVDLSALREAVQRSEGISYYQYNPNDTSNLNGKGAATRKQFASDSANELEAFVETHERTDTTLTRTEKLRFMNKKESDVPSFSKEDWAEYNRLKTHADLEPDQAQTLKREDDKALRDLKVKATMQLVKKNGEVLDRDLQVFVSGGEHSSGYAYTGTDQQQKQTGQKAPGPALDGRTYDVTGQSKEDYQGVGQQHIGHHHGSREHDAEVKIVSQTVAEVVKLGKDLDGATLRIFVDRYTCPNCSDLLYKAKTENVLLAKLAAIEVIYTGART